MTRPSEEIERDVEAARGELDRTVEALKDKMTPGQLIDELSRSFKGGELMGNLGDQVRENPMALAMIGAGMAWLMMGKGDAGSAPPPVTGAYGGPDTGEPRAPAGGASQAAGHLGDKVGSAADSVKHAATDAAGRAADQLHDLGGQAADMGHKAMGSFDHILRQEPLVVGALGLAVGVALGAAFPATPLEDRTFGSARDDLLKAGETKLAAAGEGLKASGKAALEAATAEADQQGLTGGDDGSVVEKAERVIRSGLEAGRQALGQGPS